MSTWVCACICFSFVPEMIERMKVWYVIEFWHKCTEGLKNLIRISSIRNNKKYPTIKKIFEAGDFYAILSDIVEKIIYQHFSRRESSFCFRVADNFLLFFHFKANSNVQAALFSQQLTFRQSTTGVSFIILDIFVISLFISD